MLWLGQISPGADYLTQMAAPMVLLGIGMGSALTPLTTAGMAGVADADAGAASGLINVAHQLGGTLGVGALVTVFAAASSGAGAHALVEGVPTVLAGAAILIALALTTVLGVMRPRLLPGPGRRWRHEVARDRRCEAADARGAGASSAQSRPLPEHSTFRRVAVFVPLRPRRSHAARRG